MNEYVEKIKALAALFTRGGVVFFGGAGVSTESGIPDFRSSRGIYSRDYNGYPPEFILSHEFFLRSTADFYRFYKNVLINPDVKPNDAHYVLARLEKKGLVDAVITQNIDALHTDAGSKNVIELHGCVRRNTCMRCGMKLGLDAVMLTPGVPKCFCGGTIKPDVVLYGEELDEELLLKSQEAIYNAKTLIVAGTSLTVQPAASLLNFYRGDALVLINKTKTPADSRAALIFHDSIGQVLRDAENAMEKQ
jgi:NAD-dependent deacetylase